MSDVTQNNQISIELDEKTADGTYANLVVINHSNSEFVFDFVNIMPGAPKAKVKSRIILAPQHAQRLLTALTDNIQKYESINGPIKEGGVTNVSPYNLGPSGDA
ncbi:DUF3467 domain-containing protein [Flavobacterium agricola]|uniref:DUF3467 domain-containing protein n=1 Tax=Flavobacterium agricola TaxID=2870839 RepID=A0ABY6LZE3_9FLAO|nr:DUF3467 domain-containing protein [Flavobacterium agricola]UYW00535.1 DUF3467 domain-containing protein [Flavobacterium agricola]